MTHEKSIYIKGARVHNLKNIEVEIPHDKLVVVTGLSGSGKSTLAFDTIFAEGQRRYVESLSAYARQFLGKINKPDVDLITGIAPAIAIEQKVNTRNPRSTVGTTTEIYDYLKLLFARIGRTFSPVSGQRGALLQRGRRGDQYVLALVEGSRKPLIAAPLVLAEGQGVIEKLTLLARRRPDAASTSDGRDAFHRGDAPLDRRHDRSRDDLSGRRSTACASRPDEDTLTPHARLRGARASPTATASAPSSCGRGDAERVLVALRGRTASHSNSRPNTCSASTTRWGPVPAARATAR